MGEWKKVSTHYNYAIVHIQYLHWLSKYLPTSLWVYALAAFIPATILQRGSLESLVLLTSRAGAHLPQLVVRPKMRHTRRAVGEICFMTETCVESCVNFLS